MKNDRPAHGWFIKATRKKWLFGGLAVALIILIVATRYGARPPGVSQNDRESAHQRITSPATMQAFDERLSLSMPVGFGPGTDIPLEKFPGEIREKIQKMTQRSAYFNGIYVVVMKLTNARGVKADVEENLHNVFFRSANPPSPTMPKVSSTYLTGVYESGAIRFPAVFGNSRGQMTAVVIKSETEQALWFVSAWGRGEAADLAEKTARGFAFK